MALSFLFWRNAELCTKMAAEAKSIVVREQWIELAKQWQQKGEAEELLTGSYPEPIPSPTLSPSPLHDRSEHAQPEHTATSAPTLVPFAAPMPKVEAIHAARAPSEARGTGGLDDLWSQLIVDIRTRR